MKSFVQRSMRLKFHRLHSDQDDSERLGYQYLLFGWITLPEDKIAVISGLLLQPESYKLVLLYSGYNILTKDLLHQQLYVLTVNLCYMSKWIPSSSLTWILGSWTFRKS